MSAMQAFYADHFVLPLPDGHRFPMAKYEMLRDQITAHLPSVRLQQAEPADDAALALVHDPAYIDAVRHGTLSAAQQREIGFPWSPGMNERARRSVGATVQACRAALSGEGVAANLAGAAVRGDNPHLCQLILARYAFGAMELLDGTPTRLPDDLDGDDS